MKKKTTIGIIIIALLMAVFASVYLISRQAIPAGNLKISVNGSNVFIDPFSAGTTDVKGTTVNAKGEKKDVEAKGVRLEEALKAAKVTPDDYPKIKVVSSDEYSAELTPEEVKAADKVFLIDDKDKDTGNKSIRLIVFGDNDSKRQVKNVERIELNK